MYSKKQYRRDRTLAFMVLVIFIVGSCLLNDFDKAINASSESRESRTTDFQAVDDKVYQREVGSVKTDLKRSEKKYLGTFTVTYYCPCRLCTPGHGITASGKKVKPGMIAASRGTKFGTKLSIGGKIYTVEDRLSRRFDGRIDIFVKDHKTALRNGIKILKVYEVKE